MKITKQYLKQVIKEELEKELNNENFLTDIGSKLKGAFGGKKQPEKPKYPELHKIILDVSKGSYWHPQSAQKILNAINNLQPYIAKELTIIFDDNSKYSELRRDSFDMMDNNPDEFLKKLNAAIKDPKHDLISSLEIQVLGKAGEIGSSFFSGARYDPEDLSHLLTLPVKDQRAWLISNTEAGRNGHWLRPTDTEVRTGIRDEIDKLSGRY